jgi:predicted homoserine dehydrogenase-like protein
MTSPLSAARLKKVGVLHQKGQVEVVSSLERDGRVIPYDIRMGVFVVFEGETDYIRNCFSEYKVRTDPSGRYACLYKRWHLIGLEVGISVASVGLRGEATGSPICLNADVVATAKRDLAPGEMLDGEGGYTVVGSLFQAKQSKSDQRPTPGPGAQPQSHARSQSRTTLKLGRCCRRHQPSGLPTA